MSQCDGALICRRRPEEREAHLLPQGYLPSAASLRSQRYGQNHDMFGGNISSACASAADTTVNLTGTEATRFGIGLQQDIDAAATQL